MLNSETGEREEGERNCESYHLLGEIELWWDMIAYFMGYEIINLNL